MSNSQLKDYGKILAQIRDEVIPLLDRLRQIKTIGIAVVREQRKLPGDNNAKFCEYMSKLLIQDCPDGFVLVSKAEYDELKRVAATVIEGETDV